METNRRFVSDHLGQPPSATEDELTKTIERYTGAPIEVACRDAGPEGAHPARGSLAGELRCA